MKAITYVSLLALALSSCSTEEPAQQPVAVRVTEVRVGPMREGLRYLGEVESVHTVKLMARLQGTVTELPVAEGGAARAGDELVRMATPDMAARLQRVRAEAERARTERDHACRRTETDRRLGEAGDLPGDKVDFSIKACSSATSAARAAEAAVRETSAVTARGVERAPFDGELLALLVDPGQSVMPGTPLVVFGTDSQELVVRVSERDLGSGIEVGTPVTLTLPDGEELRAEVGSVGAQAVGPARTVEVRVPVPGGPHLLTGQRLDLLFVLHEVQEATSVPELALVRDGESVWVYLLTGDRLSRTDVEVGPSRDGWVSLTPALPAGSRVALGASPSLDPTREIMAVEVSP